MKKLLTSDISSVLELLTLEDEQREPTQAEIEEGERLVQSLDLIELLQNEEI